jgi:hypothetical protein
LEGRHPGIPTFIFLRYEPRGVLYVHGTVRTMMNTSYTVTCTPVTNEMDAKFAFQLTTRRNIALVGDPPLTSFGESKEWKFAIPSLGRHLTGVGFDVAIRRQNEHFWSLKKEIDTLQERKM